MELEEAIIEQLIQTPDQFQQKINEATFILRKELEKKQEKKEDDEKEDVLLGQGQTAGMDRIIANLSESGSEIEPAPNINNNNNNNNGIEPASNINNRNEDIPRAPNIDENKNNESEISNEEDDDVHNKEDLKEKVEKMREISRSNIEKSVQNELYTKDNPTLGL